jgi:hypothetical protein
MEGRSSDFRTPLDKEEGLLDEYVDAPTLGTIAVWLDSAVHGADGSVSVG